MSGTTTLPTTKSPGTPTTAAVATERHSPLPQPTVAQRQVLQRIAKQRERLKARRAAHLQTLALAAESEGKEGANDSLVMRAAGFARQHPWAVAAAAGLAMVAGPRRLIQWAGIVLPMVMRFKNR